MVLINTKPDDDWKHHGRSNDCELFVYGNIEIKEGSAKIVKQNEGQNLVKFALQIEEIGEDGDEYRD